MRPCCVVGDTSPRARQRATHLIAELGATPKRSAADRQDAPAATVFTTRSRKSFEQAFGIRCWPPNPAAMLNQKTNAV
jgi:hypothetical protein